MNRDLTLNSACRCPTRLLIDSFGETATQWRLDDRSWQERACRMANRNLDEGEWQHFMGDRPYAEVCTELP